MPWKSSVKLVFTLSLQVAESTCPSRVAVGLSVLSSASLAQTSNSLRCPFTLSLSVKVVFKRIPSCVVSSDDASSETTAPVSCPGSAANALVGIMVVIIKKVRNHARILEANLFSLRSICSSSFAFWRFASVCFFYFTHAHICVFLFRFPPSLSVCSPIS